MSGVRDTASAQELAGTVLEAMSQDSGPADCEPFTGWCVDLARQVLACRAVLTQHEQALRAIQKRGEQGGRLCDCSRGMWRIAHEALAARALPPVPVRGDEQ